MSTTANYQAAERLDLWARSTADGCEWALAADGQPEHQYGLELPGELSA
ncbi:hypothetical protein [Catellatospora vulcania]|nr:hypothetical protein [Catellatospora vulcania]